MINMDTVRLVGLLNELAKKSENGIQPLSESFEDDFLDCLIYDDTKMNENGEYPLVMEICIDENDEMVAFYFDSKSSGIKQPCEIVVCPPECDDCDCEYCGYDGACELAPYVAVKIDNEIIAVEDGRWYVMDKFPDEI